MWRLYYLFVLFKGVGFVRSQFTECHDDPSFEPDEGPLSEMQFTWLGVLQYIHVKNGTPHYFRVPRVILISRQFVLSTAIDAAQVPDGYALGNVAFGEYERDEEECGVTIEALAAGAQCEPAGLIVPLSDVLLHPEYKHFGVAHSVALLKMITTVKSMYMLPACLPFMEYALGDSAARSRVDVIYHVDFSIDVPRDFVNEEKEVTRISALPRELCFLYNENENNASYPAINRIMCSTGCGFHSGAPSIVHEHTGHFTIVALAQGGAPCPDPLRTRRKSPLPQHILLHPYVPWITAAITGKAEGAFSKDDPFGFIMPRAGPVTQSNLGWTGHWWVAGLRCYDRGLAAQDLFKFYHEIFFVEPSGDTFLTYYLELHAGHGTVVTCLKVGMPFRLGNPKIWHIESPEVKVVIPVLRFFHTYKFQVEAWAYNKTDTSESAVTKKNYNKDSDYDSGNEP